MGEGCCVCALGISDWDLLMWDVLEFGIDLFVLFCCDVLGFIAFSFFSLFVGVLGGRFCFMKIDYYF
jgi:hypothetical protein